MPFSVPEGAKARDHYRWFLIITGGFDHFRQSVSVSEGAKARVRVPGRDPGTLTISGGF